MSNIPDEAVRLLRIIELARERLTLEFGIDPDFAPQVDTPTDPVVLEDEPGWLGPGEQWADDHLGDQYRRPKGVVVYTVVGGYGPYGGVMMRRSSDGKEVPMDIRSLERMVQL